MSLTSVALSAVPDAAPTGRLDEITAGRAVSAAGSAETPDELGLSDEFTGLAEAESELRQVVVGVAQHGARLDRALVELVPEFSRSYLQQLLSQGLVSLNGRPATKAAVRVKAGDPVSVEMRPTLQSQAFRPESLPIDVVYEDEHLLVINKPAGLVVHPAPGNWGGTLLNGLLARDEKAQWGPDSCCQGSGHYGCARVHDRRAGSASAIPGLGAPALDGAPQPDGASPHRARSTQPFAHGCSQPGQSSRQNCAHGCAMACRQ
mgnify:CR=1 FL=1